MGDVSQRGDPGVEQARVTEAGGGSHGVSKADLPAPAEHLSLTFDPDWCIHPGETLREWREENGLGLKSAATACALTPEQFEKIEAGKLRISTALACKLQQGTGIPATLWLKLESMFRVGLAAGKTWTR